MIGLEFVLLWNSLFNLNLSETPDFPIPVKFKKVTVLSQNDKYKVQSTQPNSLNEVSNYIQFLASTNRTKDTAVANPRLHPNNY